MWRRRLKVSLLCLGGGVAGLIIAHAARTTVLRLQFEERIEHLRALGDPRAPSLDSEELWQILKLAMADEHEDVQLAAWSVAAKPRIQAVGTRPSWGLAGLLMRTRGLLRLLPH